MRSPGHYLCDSTSVKDSGLRGDPGARSEFAAYLVGGPHVDLLGAEIEQVGVMRCFGAIRDAVLGEEDAEAELDRIDGGRPDATAGRGARAVMVPTMFAGLVAARGASHGIAGKRPAG